MAQQTTLKPNAVPGGVYSSFSGKVETLYTNEFVTGTVFSPNSTGTVFSPNSTGTVFSPNSTGTVKGL